MGSERKPSKKKMGMMVKGALFMCLLQAVLGKHIYPVPDPYRWDESFTVELPRIDDEHRGLFNAILLIERDNTKEHLTDAYIKYRDHFEYEEGLFSQTKDDEYVDSHKMKHKTFMDKMTGWSAPVSQDQLNWAKNWLVQHIKDIKVAQDWLAQHIKNTDFEYRGKLKHAVPNPYVWDETFATDYKQIDDEHTVLFENILAVSQHPEDPEVLAKLKTLLEQHFEYEEGKFCEIPSYNCIDHKMKHYKFFVTFKDLKVPIGCEEIHWAKNWLAQHIKNTDHQYKERFLPPF